MSKLNENVRRFYGLGYIPEDGGKLKSPKGRYLSLTIDNNNYYYWQTRDRDTGYQPRVYYHKIVAYHLYGEKVFQEGVVVRHLNGNSLDNSFINIAIGSAHDNWMDVPENIRQKISDCGALVQRKLDKQKLNEFYTDRSNGMTYKKLMEKYGIAKSTVSYIVNGKTYKK
jgi:hypothetical protein